MSNGSITLMAHLIRRAGFGAPREQVETYAAKGYENTVEELINIQEFDPSDDHLLLRYHPNTIIPGGDPPDAHMRWLYHMVNTKRPLEEKMTLFWHQVLATAVSKVDNYPQMLDQINLLRRHAVGNFRDILTEVAMDPAMIYWLDNNENHEYAINENWGRELLELFSMGVGSYTEGDIKEAARAFTGWTITPKIPRQPYKRFPWSFEYRYDDHDEGEKIFLGERGRFNGEDIIDIIVRQPATARFISRHLYNFFVADEPQVPSWSRTPARDPEAIEVLSRAYFDHKYDFKSILRELFNSEFFKRARFARVKSPAELVAGTLRLAGAYQFPTPNDRQLAMQPIYMGQDLMNPPTVEGWHTGREWINSGTLVSRVNFVSALLADLSLPGVQTIISMVRAGGDLTPEELVDVCLDLMGPLDVEEATRRELIDHAQEGGDLKWAGEGEQTSAQRVSEMLQLIAGIQEYQLG